MKSTIMKYLLVMLLCVAVLFSLVACNGGNGTSKDTDPAQTTPQTERVTTPETEPVTEPATEASTAYPEDGPDWSYNY